MVSLMWMVKIYEVLSGIRLSHWGIYPRALDGLWGIVFSPFLHSGYQHLVSNSLPMLALLTITTLFYKRVAVSSLVIITMLTGFLVWLFARSTYHIGASGVVYGLVSFVFWTGVFRKNRKSIILSLVILTLFSGYFYGIVPDKEGISWESHLFGGFAGILTAFAFRSVIEEDEKPEDPWANESTGTHYFLPRDAFDLTKQERYYRDMIAAMQEE